MSDSVRPHRRQPTRLPCPWDSPGKNTGVGCHFLLQCMKVKRESEVAQSYPTLSDPMDCSLPGSSIHGIFQARVLEWGAIAFSECRYSCLLIQCPPLEKQGLYGLWSHDINVVDLEQYFRNFYFEIIKGTQEVEKNSSERSHVPIIQPL